MNRLIVDSLELAHKQEWVDYHGNMCINLGFTRGQRTKVYPINPKIHQWSKIDPNKYQMFATDQGLFLGGFTQLDGEFGVGINLDLIKQTLEQRFEHWTRAVYFGKIVKQGEVFNYKNWLETSRYYYQHPDTNEIIDAETQEIVSTDEDVVLYNIFVVANLRGLKNTYYLMPNAELMDYRKIEVNSPAWKIISMDKHDWDLRRFLLNPSYDDCIKIDENLLVAKKKQFSINPFGQCRIIAPSITDDPFITPHEIKVRVHSDMEYTVDENKVYTFTVNGPVNYVQFKIHTTTDFDYHPKLLSVQRAYTVINKSG